MVIKFIFLYNCLLVAVSAQCTINKQFDCITQLSDVERNKKGSIFRPTKMSRLFRDTMVT